MTRRIARLTLDHLDALGPQVACRSCVHWELDPVRRARLPDESARAAEKDAWISRLLRDWGSCGRVVLVDDRVVGYVVYAPEAYVPGAAAYPTAPVSPDAVLMTTAWIHPDHVGGGLGRMLVQGMARDLVTRGGLHAVEAFGAARPGSAQGACLVPVEFLARVGFRTHRAHPRTPRMRMDLRTALTWRDEVEAAVERLLGAVRPSAAPARGPATTTAAPRSTAPSDAAVVEWGGCAGLRR